MLCESSREKDNSYYFPNILTRNLFFIVVFPEHLQASVPQSTLWEPMTFVSKHLPNLAYGTSSVLGVHGFRELWFIINHTVGRDFAKFTFMNLIVTVSGAQ